jgi:hypothetical protein
LLYKHPYTAWSLLAFVLLLWVVVAVVAIRAYLQ